MDSRKHLIDLYAKLDGDGFSKLQEMKQADRKHFLGHIMACQLGANGRYTPKTLEYVCLLPLKEQDEVFLLAKDVYRKFLARQASLDGILTLDKTARNRLGKKPRKSILLGSPHRKEEECGLWRQQLPGFLSPHGWRFGAFEPVGYGVDAAKNAIAKKALMDDWDYVLYLDDDVYPNDPDFLNLLLKSNKDVICGVYNKKHKTRESTCLTIDEKGRSALVEDGHWGVLPADTCVGGLLLVAVKVFGMLEEPWFVTMKSGGASISTEDVYFTQKCQDAGIECWIHAHVRARHLDRATNIWY